MPSKRVYFENASGIRLAGIIEMPITPVRAFALFAHCFTCTKDLKAIVRISRALAGHGLGVLRFDFTGLGDSQGDFSNSNFETCLADVASAARWLGDEHQSPQLLIGHSFGGAAMMVQSRHIPSVNALVTIASPSCVKHLAEFLSNSNPAIETDGLGHVIIGGRTHIIRQQFLDNLRKRDLEAEIKQIAVPHLIFHSRSDETLDYRHAEEIFAWTGGARSLITLVGSDHLLVNQPGDVAYVSDLIATWSGCFLNEPASKGPLDLRLNA